jgi:hypothetical protein
METIMAKRNAEQFAEDAQDLDDYDDILDRSFNDIPMPKDVPLTSYNAVCDGISFMKPKKEGTSPKVLAFFKLTSPVEPLDDDVQAELGADYDFNLNRYARSIWISEGRDWKTVLEILHSLGVDTEDCTVNEAMKSAKGKEAVVRLQRGRVYTGTDGKEHGGQIEVGSIYGVADEDD